MSKEQVADRKSQNGKPKVAFLTLPVAKGVS